MTDFDYSKISVTAKLVAFFRKFSDIPFATEVADSVHAEEALQEILRNLELQSNPTTACSGEMPDEGKMYAPLLEARYKSIAQLILKSGYKQILELASGFSLRGLAMAQDPQFVYVESDLRGINEEKKKLVGDMRIKYALPELGNHHIVTANALALSELEHTLVYFRKDEPLVIVNEGLIQYLSETEREAVAINVRELLKQFSSGLWITPDFTTQQVADNVSDNAKRFRMAIAGVTDRRLYAAAFETETALNRFIRDCGFDAQCLNQTDEVKDLTSITALGLRPEVLEQLKPKMRIWQLTLKNQDRTHH